MNLIALRNEVLAHGFDPVQYGARIDNYLNDAMNLVARRANYYVNEGVYTFSTVGGTDEYTLLNVTTTQENVLSYVVDNDPFSPTFGQLIPVITPTPIPDFARARSLFDTTRRVELQYVSTRQIDRSADVQGAPTYYTIDGQNLRLYPKPDGVYPLEFRYWRLPPPLMQDTDTPSMPQDWHRLLWYYAVAECYAGDDDLGTGGQWMQKFTEGLAEFEADQKFPDSDGPSQAADMWGSDDALGTSHAWTRW